MKTLITGAAGGLGSHVCRLLFEQGHEVVAADRAEREPLPVSLHVVDMLDRPAVAPLLAGVDAVVHLANHTDANPREAEKIFSENAAMNMNVFQAAYDHEVKKIVFASSVQVISSAHRRFRTPDKLPHVPHLPLDSDLPPRPANSYALSKQVGEVMLQYFTSVADIQTIAVRFPWMTRAVSPPRSDDLDKVDPGAVESGFSYLSYPDAARLVAAILHASLPGFRIYLPAERQNTAGLSPRQLIDRFYAHVPLRRPIDQIDALVDVSAITRETGWKPSENLER